MSKQKYEALANSVIELIGGKENITYFTHCVTRLRFVVKDQSAVKANDVEKIDGVLGCQWNGGQFQIIIGQSVGDAYKLICEKADLEQIREIDDESSPKKKVTIKGFLSDTLDAISACLTPVIPALIGCGMIKVIVLCLQTFLGMDVASSTSQILTFVGDAGFYFLPIIVGANAAKKFGANQALGMVIGGMLVYPTFVTEVAAGTSFDIFGLPIYGASYTSTIFPVILCIWVMAPIEKFFAKHSPDSLRSIIEPLCTIIIMIPLAFCLLAPAGAFLGNYLSTFVIWLYNTIGFVGVGFLAAFMPFIIMTGMHSAFVPYLLQMFSTSGFEPIFFPAIVISNINQGIASLAVAIKAKDTNTKSTAISCAITAVIGGVTEPAMYGINLKYKKPMWGAMIGSAVGGMFAGLMNVYCYAFIGVSSLFGIPCFIGGDSTSNLVLICISILIGVIVTFVLTLFLYKEEN